MLSDDDSYSDSHSFPYMMPCTKGDIITLGTNCSDDALSVFPTQEFSSRHVPAKTGYGIGWGYTHSAALEQLGELNADRLGIEKLAISASLTKTLHDLSCC